MKKTNLIYIIFALLFFIAVVFTTISSVVVDSQNEYNEKVFSEAKSTKNFDHFIAMQTKKYYEVMSGKKNEYRYNVYHVINNKDEEEIVLIIIPENIVTHAKTSKDPNDKSRVIISVKDSGKVVLDTDEKKIAISYGYSQEKIGFMFFNTIYKEEGLNVKYQDYLGDLIFDLEVKIDTRNESFKKGLSLDEIKKDMGYELKLKKKLILNMTIYLIMVIFAPFLYKLIKHKRAKSGR